MEGSKSMEAELKVVERKQRRFLSEDFKVISWENIRPYYHTLLSRMITNPEDLKRWLKDRSELESALSEDLGWRYIRMTCDTADKKHADEFQFFIREIEPKIAPYSNKLNKKATESEFADILSKEKAYEVLFRGIRKELEIYREENIPLLTEVQSEAQKFGQISGAMTVDVNGQEMTLQQAAVLLQSTDRPLREDVYQKIATRRIKDREKLDGLFSNLITIRHSISTNAGFNNFRDYMFKAMGRFDYEPKDCFDFHNSIESEVVPLLDDLASKRKEALKCKQLRPWDKAVDPLGREPLKPFETGKDLLDRSVAAFSRLDPYLGERLKIMDRMGHLDLESRKGKSPGGYNYPLMEIGVPFIFMNATSTVRDMVTLMHEGGHAVHSFLAQDLELTDFKNCPSEVAELASMSMELLSMDHWDQFFDDPASLNRAKKEHLEQVIETLPWVATIDKFQHWIYENPQHSHDERTQSWIAIFETFSDSITDWSGLEKYRDALWQKQLHLFEVPFYYIEYGMAQLGAIAVWKNYRENPEEGLKQYLDALKLGNTRTIPEVYEAAGIRFDFSATYIQELIGFVKKELEIYDQRGV